MSSGTLKNQLIQSAIQVAVLNVVAAIVTATLGIVLARGLGAQGYGVYVYAMTLLSFLVLLGQLGVPTLVTRHTVRSQIRSEWASLRSMLIRFSQLMTLTSFVMILVSLFALWWFSEHMSTHQFYTFIWLLLLAPFTQLRTLVGAVLHGMNRVVDNQVIGSVIPSVVRLITICLLFWLMPETRLPEHVAFVSLIVGIGSLSLVCLWLWRYLPEGFFRGETVYHTRRWLLNALPFILATGIGSLDSKVDIVILGFFQSADQIGLYSIALRAYLLFIVVIQIRNSVMAPHVTRMYLQNNIRQLQRMVTISSRILFVGVAGAALAVVLFGEAIMVWLLGNEFYGAYPVLVILVVGTLGRVAIGPVFVLAHMTHHEKDAMRALGISLVMNTVLNLALIPFYGIAGAAAATITSRIFGNLYLHSIIKSGIGIKCHIF